MASSDPPLVEVKENKTKKRAPRKFALASQIVNPDVGVGSPDHKYVPCSNQNGEVQSPVWMFFRFGSQIWRKHSLGHVSAIAKLLGVRRFAIAVSAAAPKLFQSILKMSTVGHFIFARQLLQMSAPKAKFWSREITQILLLRGQA